MANKPNSRPDLTSTQAPALETITGRTVLDRHLSRLATADSRLAPLLEAAGEVPLRLKTGGFAGMAEIVIAQLLSVASARAIQARFASLLGDISAQALLAENPADLRQAGLSHAKIATLRNLAEAEISGALDYATLGQVPADRAIARLCELKGIGVWSAEIYLLFCTGHPDIFPAGDLALRKSAQSALALNATPSEKQLRELASLWSPWRGSAARLLWRHYAQMKSREGAIA